jgi:PAS domain S-box-containing protein
MNTESAQSKSSTASAAAPVAAASGLDPVFTTLARLAAVSCGSRFASVALSGSGVAWCASSGPLGQGAALGPDALTAVVGSAPALVEVKDAQRDRRFGPTPLTIDGVAIHSYAGLALRTAAGELLGALAIYDTSPRQLTADQRLALSLVADECVSQAEIRARVAELALASSRPSPRSAADAESFASALLESAPVAIYHTDGLGNSAYLNRAYREIFGLRPEDTDADWVQCVHPDDRSRMQAAWADFRAHPRTMRFEYRSDPRRSSSRHLSEQVVPVVGASGYVGAITDVTDLTAARADLRRVETLFRNTFEQAPIGVAYQDRSGTFLRCNQAFSDLLGYSGPDEIRDKTISDLTHPDDLAFGLLAFERLWNGDIQFIDDEKRYRHKDGHDVWVRLTTALVHAGEGTPDRAVEFLRDISVRKQLAADLVRQQTLLEAVIANMPLALLACDATGAITHSNHAAEDLFALPPSGGSGSALPPLGQLAMHTYLADGATTVDSDNLPLPRALAGEIISDLELVIAPPNASPRTTLANARRLAGPSGQTLGAVAVWQDVTERKAADLELERVHKQLMAASRQAGMAEVATNVLHNVGNILNSINISASLLADRVKQSKAEALGRVAALLKEQGPAIGNFIAADERGKRIPDYLTSLGAQLVADQQAELHELASLRSNLEHIKETVAMQQSYAKLCGVTETVDVTDLVEDSLRLNAGAFARHGVALRREYADVLPITVDKHKVLQILVNLVRNAKYACDESGRQDKLLTLRVEAIPSGVRISIIDNGVGIAPENMPRLFHHGFTTRQSGHGFGLHSGAVAAQELGGSLRAASDGIGLGATFVLELPRLPRSMESV